MPRHDRMAMALAMATLAMGCSNDENATYDSQAGSDNGTADPTRDSETANTTNGTTNPTNDPSETSDPGDTSQTDTGGPVAETGDAESTGDATTDEGGEGSEETAAPPFGSLPHEETFDGPDGSAWPMPWTEAGTAVVSATLVDGRGYLVGETGQVARMVLPGFEVTDVDIVVTVGFDNWLQQGFGLYVRQNGGALQETDPPGQGYAAYVEGGFMQSLGIWRELGGVEEYLQVAQVPGGTLAPGVHHYLRLQCIQEGPATRLRTRIWRVDEPEPVTWLVEVLDDTPALQETPGSFAVDLYNYSGNGGLLVDDLQVDAI